MARPVADLNEDADLVRRIQERLAQQTAQAAARADTFSPLAPVARTLENVGGALGEAFEVAKSIPGVEGGLNVQIGRAHV